MPLLSPSAPYAPEPVFFPSKKRTGISNCFYRGESRGRQKDAAENEIWSQEEIKYQDNEKYGIGLEFSV